MPDKSNDTGSRIKHVGHGAHSVPAKNVFGTPEEIGARVGGTFKSLPDNKPSNFRQLGPGGSGGTTQNAGVVKRAGNQKFGDPRSYS